MRPPELIARRSFYSKVGNRPRFLGIGIEKYGVVFLKVGNWIKNEPERLQRAVRSARRCLRSCDLGDGMTPENFCYWLQGFVEVQPNTPPSADGWKVVADHLQLVFKKETPVRVHAPGPAEIQRSAQDDYIQRMRDQNRTVVSSGIPQCGIGQPSIQYGRNPPNIC